MNVNDLQIKALQQTELQGIDVGNTLSERFARKYDNLSYNREECERTEFSEF